MSLRSTRTYVVPEQTARITQAAFPTGTLCLQLYEHLGTIFEDQDGTELFPRRGQPAAAPFRLALVTIWQFVESLSDRAAAHAVRGRLDWKYLLGLELDDPGFGYSVLCEFRPRLLSGGAEQRLGEKLLAILRTHHAGIEGTISQGTCAFGLRRARYLGQAKLRLQHVATAVAMNLVRLDAWWSGAEPVSARSSAFVRVMKPMAA